MALFYHGRPKSAMLCAVGKFFALLILVVMTVWLAPMCAQLPTQAQPVAVVAPPDEPPSEPIVEPVVPMPALDTPAVVISNYRTRKMFTIADGYGRISVLLTNKSERDAVDLRLGMTAMREGKDVENARVNTAFTIAADSSAYRGLQVSMAMLDALLAEPAAKDLELRWDLTYRLDGDAESTKRCFTLRALPRQRNPVGIEWRTLGESRACETTSR